jgi:FixJ family two-component response regulator
MPSMSGLELLDKLCRDNIFLPVVLMTGRPDAAIAKAAARAGAILLEKPFKGTELLNCVKRMLGVH